MRDPRSLVGQPFTIGEQDLPLSGSAGEWRTPLFYVPSGKSPQHSAGAPPGAIAVELLGLDEASWRYGDAPVTLRDGEPVDPRPAGKVPQVKFTPSTTWDKEFFPLVDRITLEMKNEGWAPSNPTDSGAFGKEVHRRVALRLQGDLWMHDVYVDRNTKTVLSISNPPTGVPNTTYTQVDSLRLKSGYRPAVGEVLNPGLIDELYEVKTSVTDQLTDDQRLRLRNVLGRTFQVCTPQWRRNAAGLWRENPRWSLKKAALATIILTGAGTAVAVYNLGHPEAFDDQLNEINYWAIQYRNSADDRFQGPIDKYYLLLAVKDYFSNFTPDDTALKIMVVGTFYWTYGSQE